MQRLSTFASSRNDLAPEQQRIEKTQSHIISNIINYIYICVYLFFDFTIINIYICIRLLGYRTVHDWVIFFGDGVLHSIHIHIHVLYIHIVFV